MIYKARQSPQALQTFHFAAYLGLEIQRDNQEFGKPQYLTCELHSAWWIYTTVFNLPALPEIVSNNKGERLESCQNRAGQLCKCLYISNQVQHLASIALESRTQTVTDNRMNHRLQQLEHRTESPSAS